MRGWALFLPFAGMVALSGYMGFRLGQSTETPETAAVNRWAAEYVAWAGEGAALTDCVARPHPAGDIWLVITCRRPDGKGAAVTYPIDPDGRVMRFDGESGFGPKT